jgi:hypothetical protein
VDDYILDRLAENFNHFNCDVTIKKGNLTVRIGFDDQEDRKRLHIPIEKYIFEYIECYIGGDEKEEYKIIAKGYIAALESIVNKIKEKYEIK